MFLASYFVLLSVAVSGVSAVDPVVDLGYTKYRGIQSEDGISKWKGMRFAAPPLGTNRFRAALPPIENESGVIEDADEFQPTCLSTNDAYNASRTDVSEDCLFLNLYAPTDATTHSKLPVYIFIQGGGFQSLSNRNYDGTGLIKAGDMQIVVVNFNYRVGPYGFLASKEVQEDGDTNVGLLDQRALFKWVQKHVAKFGGDPNHVTIGGASAGGASVDLHMSAYGGRDDGLFQAAAAESQSFPAQLTVSEAQYQYDFLVEASGCAQNSTNGTVPYPTNSTLDCLRALDVSVLQTANINIPFPNNTGVDPQFTYGCVIDGTFVTDYTYKLYRTGQFVRIPAIYGDTTNEGTVFAPRDTDSYDEMNNFLQSNFPRLTSTQLSKIDSLYLVAEQFPDSGEYWRTLSNAYGEMRYICPGIFISGALATSSASDSNGSYPTSYPTWNYHYAVLDPELNASGLGTTHTEEIVAIWGTEYSGGSAPASYNDTSAESNGPIVPIMQGYWSSFIRTYDPNTYRAEGTPEWAAFTYDGKERIYLNATGTRMETVDEGQRERCAYLSGIGESVQQRVGDIVEAGIAVVGNPAEEVDDGSGGGSGYKLRRR